MVLQLKQNIAVFSAFKSHSQQAEIHSLLVDENNKQRSFNDFRTEALKIDSKYNQQWLSAEYNLATRQARSAKQWQGFESKKDIYPNLQYMASRSAKQRDAHKQYYGKIFSIDDSIWDTIMPPNGWGCKCWVQQTRDDAPKYDGIEPLQPIPGIAGNSGKSGMIFTATHPYVSNSDKIDKEQIKQQLPILKAQNVELINVKVGKNTLSISTLADQSDLRDNIDFIAPFIKQLKKDFGIRGHITGKDLKVKNPEFNQSNLIGDMTKLGSKALNKYVDNSFDKLRKGGQLRDQNCFLGLDFKGSLKSSNFDITIGQLYSKMERYKNLKYVLLSNGDKILKFDNKKKLEVKTMFDTIKKGLL